VALRDDTPALALRGIAMASSASSAGRASSSRVRRASSIGGAARARADPRGGGRGRARRPRSRALAPRARRSDRDARGARRSSQRPARAPRRDPARGAVGRLDSARRDLETLDLRDAPPALAATAALCAADLAVRTIEPAGARESLDRALVSARAAGIAALVAEIERARATLDAPAAKLVHHGAERLLRIDDVRALLASSDLVIDGCRRVVRRGGDAVSLHRRPVLFALARALGEAWPGDVPRDVLIERAFERATPRA
jgi:hypothetical protein